MKKGVGAINRKKLLDLIAIIFIVSPVIAIAYLINKFAVNVPYWDDWHTANFLIKYYDGTLQISDFYIQNNEHRPVTTFLVNFATALLSNYNVVYEIYVSLILIIGILLILYLIFRKEHKGLSLLFFVPVSFLLFSLRQYTNYMWGFENCVYFSIFGFVLMIYLIAYHNSYKTLVLAILSGILATFSFFVILVIWPIGLISVILSGRKKEHIAVWLISSCAVFLVYFWNWKKSSETASLLNFTSISNLAGYFFALIGSPLAGDWISALGAGALLTAITLVVLYYLYATKNVQKNNFAICLLMFAFAFSITNAIGRAGWGTSYAFMSRYTPFNLLVPIALYMILLKTTGWSNTAAGIKNAGYICAALLSIVIVGLIAGNVQGLQEMQSESPSSISGDNLVNDQYYLLSYKYQTDDNLKFIHPSVDYLKYVIPQIEKYRLNVFDVESPDNLTVSAQSTYSSIDRIASLPVLNKTIDLNDTGESIVVEGWAIDAQHNQKASAVYVSVDNTTNIPTLYNVERDDVADYFNNPGYKFSGYRAIFASSLLTEGSHLVTLKIVSANGREVYYSQPVTVNVT